MTFNSAPAPRTYVTVKQDSSDHNNSDAHIFVGAFGHFKNHLNNIKAIRRVFSGIISMLRDSVRVASNNKSGVSSSKSADEHFRTLFIIFHNFRNKPPGNPDCVEVNLLPYLKMKKN